LANKILFQVKSKEGFFKGPVKMMGQAKKDRSEEGEGLCSRLYMVGK
jgi:hypothetical protein